MSSKKRLLLIIAVLVLLLAVAFALYSSMSAKYASQNISAALPAATESPEVVEVEDEAVMEPAAEEPQDEEKQLAPNFTVYDVDGNEIELHDFIGKPIVLNFWASWCGPCQMEMPDFEEAYKTYGDQVNFLMVNMTDGARETVETASAFISDKAYTFPVFYDTAQEAAYGYGVYSLPTTYFLDSEGYGIAQASGAIDMETLQIGLDMIMQ